VTTKSTFRIEQGNNLDVLNKLIAQGVLVDSVVTDPPYSLNFMGAKWDAEVPSVEFWKLVFQVLKPGGHLLAFGGTRTYHRMVVNIEDAGFEIRDCIMWVYGSGMPKSRDISKAIDKAAAAERQVIGTKRGVTGVNLNAISRPEGHNSPNAKGCGAYGVGAKQSRIDLPVTAPATPEAEQWDGWGTGLKPAVEPIVLARKPLSEKTVAANVLKWGTGALNIGACRIPGAKPAVNRWAGGQNGRYNPIGAQGWIEDDGKGRWPANFIVDQEAAVLLDEQSGHSNSRREDGTRTIATTNDIKLVNSKTSQVNCTYDDEGGASRFFTVIPPDLTFFYCPKASSKDRRGSKHPTIKPLALMRHLCKLITPLGGTVLDPFAGSGTTGEAALLEGFNSILIEQNAEYIKDIERRLAAPLEVRTKQRKVEDRMKTVRRDEIGVGDEVGRDEQGRRLIDCVACPKKRTPEAAFGLCFTCYRREKRAQKPKTHMHAPGQQKEQIRVIKQYSQMMTAATGLGMDEDDIRQLQMLLQPYLQVVPRLLKTADISFLFEDDSQEPDSVNSSQAAA
jgi:site-specific DNA-methyltransferase (adenine-specific)